MTTGTGVKTSACPSTANGWYHIEWKFVIDNTVPLSPTGTYEIRVEGVTVYTSPAPVPLTQNNIGMMRTSSGNISRNYAAFLKDFVLWDNNGARNNDFLGTVLVTNLGPDEDIELGWTPNVGTEIFPILANIPPDPTQYMFADVPQVGDPYEAELSDLPLNTTSVKGIITYVRAAKTDGGDGQMQVSMISDGDVVSGSDRPITVAQTYWRDIFETDPHTAQPWTPAAVNAATIQIVRTV